MSAGQADGEQRANERADLRVHHHHGQVRVFIRLPDFLASVLAGSIEHRVREPEAHVSIMAIGRTPAQLALAHYAMVPPPPPALALNRQDAVPQVGDRLTLARDRGHAVDHGPRPTVAGVPRTKCGLDAD